MYHVFFSLLTIILVGCASQRTPIKVGEIPSMPESTRTHFAQGAGALAELQQQYPISENPAYYRRVEKIAKNLSSAIPEGQRIKWNIYVLEDDSVPNAAATQGNFIFVWTGMFKEVENDDQLATVMAHELGHVLAKHVLPTPQEMMNEQIAGVASSAAQIAATTGGLGQAGGLAGALVGETYKSIFVYPESKRLELEADQIGLFLMAKAGYNPEEAIRFWDNFSAKNSDMKMLSFISTHPNSALRSQTLKKMLPDAMLSYENKPKTSAPVIKENIKQTIKSPIAVYSFPDRESKVIGFLEPGTKFKSGYSYNGWIEVESPVSGYIDEDDF